MSGDFSEEELQKIKVLSAWIRLSALNNGKGDDWCFSDCDEVQEELVKRLEGVLLIARKRQISTTALGKAIAQIKLDKATWQSMVEVYGTICELQIISGNPLEMRWYRVPTEYLKGDKRAWYDWKTAKADRFRGADNRIKEIREDALLEFVKPEFFRFFIGNFMNESKFLK